jgi:hypothetical protein
MANHKDAPNTIGKKISVRQPALPTPAMYEALLALNLHTLAITRLLDGVCKTQLTQKEERDYCQATIEEVCASVSQGIAEGINSFEIARAGTAHRKRLTYEKKLMAES